MNREFAQDLIIEMLKEVKNKQDYLEKIINGEDPHNINLKKTCTYCKDVKNEDEFIRYRLNVKGHGPDRFRYGNICNHCYERWVTIPHQIKNIYGLKNKESILRYPELIESWILKNKCNKLLKKIQDENIKAS